MQFDGARRKSIFETRESIASERGLDIPNPILEDDKQLAFPLSMEFPGLKYKESLNQSGMSASNDVPVDSEAFAQGTIETDEMELEYK